PVRKIVFEIQDEIGVNIPVANPGFGDESQSIVFVYIFSFDSGRTGCSQESEIRILVQSKLVTDGEPVGHIVLHVKMTDVAVHVVRVLIRFGPVYGVISELSIVLIT